MPIKKQAKKKTGRSTRKKKSRLQKVNDLNGRLVRNAPTPRRGDNGPGEGPKTICSNAECKLRRAGCYGYEACPGYKARSG